MQDDLNNNENKNKSEGKKSIIPMWVIVLGILLIIVIPLLINILFKLDLGWDWLKAEWSAGEILTYYGTFLGPTILSIVALKQNEKFEEANDESQKKMERMNQRANKIGSSGMMVGRN